MSLFELCECAIHYDTFDYKRLLRANNDYLLYNYNGILKGFSSPFISAYHWSEISWTTNLKEFNVIVERYWV